MRIKKLIAILLVFLMLLLHVATLSEEIVVEEIIEPEIAEQEIEIDDENIIIENVDELCIEMPEIQIEEIIQEDIEEPIIEEILSDEENDIIEASIDNQLIKSQEDSFIEELEEEEKKEVEEEVEIPMEETEEEEKVEAIIEEIVKEEDDETVTEEIVQEEEENLELLESIEEIPEIAEKNLEAEDIEKESTEETPIVKNADSDEETPVFKAEVELTETLGIVDISQTVSVYNYFYDRIAKKYTVPMQTEVKQLGLDAYVRVHLNAYRTVKATGEEEEINWDFVECGILDGDGNLIEEGTPDYVLIGDTIYYTKILPKGYTFYVAYYGRLNDYQHLASSSRVSTYPSADAIQSQNFFPDFNNDDPWNNVNIQEKEKDEVEQVASLTFEIIEGEDYGNIEATTEEEQLKNYAMPGDNIEMEVQLNITGEEGYVYEVFHNIETITSMVELTNSIIENLKVWLSVDNQEKDEIYNGEIPEEKQSLGQYIKGQILNLWYSFTLVPELDNNFESEQFTIKTEYEYEIVATPTPSPTPTPTPTITPIPTPTITPTPTPTVTPSPTPTITPSPTSSPTPTPKPTSTPKPTPTNSPVPTIEPSPTPKPTPIPTATPAPTINITPSPTPIPTIIPTLTPAATLTPEEKERIKEYIITNRDKDSYLQQYQNMTEEELENMISLFDYQTPLYGDLLETGDNLPIYPFIFGGIGILILLYVIFHKRII